MRTATLVFLLTTAGYATISIANGGILYPDTLDYADGHSAWSSPILAMTGRYFGLAGVQLVAITGTILLVYLIWRNTHDTPRTGLIVSALLILGPWNSALGTAGADAAVSAALLVIQPHRRPAYAPALALVHLSGALASLSASLAHRLHMNYKLAITAACTAEIIILRTSMFGLLPSGHYPTEIQWRYLLPALAAVTLTSAKLHSKQATPSGLQILYPVLEKPRGEANTESGAESIAQDVALQVLSQRLRLGVQRNSAPDHTAAAQPPEGRLF